MVKSRGVSREYISTAQDRQSRGEGQQGRGKAGERYGKKEVRQEERYSRGGVQQTTEERYSRGEVQQERGTAEERCRGGVRLDEGFR